MPADASVFNNIKTFGDYNKLDQEFQLRRALAAQQMQTAGLDAETKKNALKMQVLSAATANKNPDELARGIQSLQNLGIDTSDVPNDVKAAAQYAQQAKIAQSPYGPLVNAALKMDSNDIQRAAVNGNAAPAGPNMGAILGVNPAPAAPPAPFPRPTPQAARTLTPKEGMDLYGAPPEQPAKPVVLSSDAPAPAPVATPAVDVPKFVPPAYDPTKSKAANDSAYQQALEAYKADPSTLAAQEKAKKKGELAATNEENASHSQEMTQRLNQNLDALEKIVPDLPSSDYADPAFKAWFDKRNPLSAKKASTAFSQFQEINQQQMINGLSELVKSGQIRGNQFIEKIISRGYMINPDDPKDAQIADIKNLRAELANINVSAQNTAGGKQNYQQIPVTTSQSQGGVVSYKDYFK